jgi:rubrerythrin
MIEEEKTVTDFIVEEVYGNLKKEYGDLPKKKSTAIKPKKINQQQIQLEQMMEREKSKEQLYSETLARLTATTKGDD